MQVFRRRPRQKIAGETGARESHVVPRPPRGSSDKAKAYRHGHHVDPFCICRNQENFHPKRSVNQPGIVYTVFFPVKSAATP
jgi:hypothetical protein